MWRLADPGRFDSFAPLSTVHGFTLFHDGAQVRLTAEQMQDGTAWGVDDTDLGRSPLDTVGLPPELDPALVEITVNQAQFVEPASQGLADGYFGGLPSATATYEGTDGELRRTHLFFATGPGYQIVVIGSIIE